MFFEEEGFMLNIVAATKKDVKLMDKKSKLNADLIFKPSNRQDNQQIKLKSSKINKSNKTTNDMKLISLNKISESNIKMKFTKKMDGIKKSLYRTEDNVTTKNYVNSSNPNKVNESKDLTKYNVKSNKKNYQIIKDDKNLANSNVLTKRKNNSRKDVEKSTHTPPTKIFKRNSLIFDKTEIPRVDQSDVKLYKEEVFSKHSFDILDLHPFMISNLEKLGIKKMTTVQHLVIPHVMNGSDVLVKSQTGSGKTYAYAIPLIQKLQSMKPNICRSDGTFCIIVVPTRELALQTLTVLTSLLRPFVWIVPGCLIGGEKRKSEKARIKKGINIMIATPGRLVDHMDSSANLELGRVQYFVIDEADRMLDMGFEKDIARIVSNLKEKGPKSKQSLLLSATLTTGVEKLAGISMKNPLKIDMTINAEDEKGNSFSTPSNLRHFYAIVPTKLRLVTLATFLISKCHFNKKPCKILCFMATQDSVEFHHNLLEASFNLADDDASDVADDAKVMMLKLYGNMDQKDRTKIYNEFHKAKSGILLCTDVAARGLDLAHVDWIIQFSCPTSAVEYIHRVGRTARIGELGHALIFLAPTEADYLHILNEHNIQVEEMKFDKILDELTTFNYKRKLDLTHKGVTPYNWQEASSFLQSQFEEKLQRDVQLRTLARKAYNSFIKSYTTYPVNLKRIFHIKNLHLGHVAASFALTETPGKVSKVVSRFLKSKPKIGSVIRGKRNKSALQSNYKKLNSNFLWMSEFDNGL